jgi:uncharacterized protein YgbK (DUF1537 family)
MPAERTEALPDGVVVAWYGDDFTGSAAVMEAMTFAGLPSVLFLGVPDAETRAAFQGYRGVGIAGVARSRSPEWMKRELPPVFEALAALNAPVSHYKICSTLDSAPDIGSIGQAIDLAVPILGGRWHPLLVAAPAIGRYQSFGNLFAVASGHIHRLDRHPTMRHHPVTPMEEADVRLHLSRQTGRKIGLVDLLDLQEPAQANSKLEAHLDSGSEIIALDVVDERSLAACGGLIWKNRGDRLFAVGSQGVEYALIAHWRATGAIGPAPAIAGAGRVERIVVASGSCSPDTAAQIAWAREHGFQTIRVRAERAVDPAAWAGELDRLATEACGMVGQGRDPLLLSAEGPDDPSIALFKEAVAASGSGTQEANARLGTGLGMVLGRILSQTKLKRGILAGGDTSGYGTMALGIEALTALAPTVPGAALFKAHGRNPVVPGLEIALKGGQMGTPDYFQWIKTGGGPSLNRSI